MLSRLERPRKSERRSIDMDIATLDQLIDFKVSGLQSSSGVPVNADTACGLTAVFCAERILSETLASIRFNLLQRTKGGQGDRERASAAEKTAPTESVADVF